MELYNIKTEYPIEGACESGIGGRSENQDSYGYQDTPFGLLVTVCDGMGGGPAGKTASSIAVNEIIASVMEAVEGTAPMEVVEAAIRRANRAIIKAVEEKPQLQGMGTTCTVVLINEVSAIVAHVGDSRVYQLRGHYKVFRTFDHSLVFEMVRDKVITEEQARLSEQSNIITRALGLDEELEIDMMERPYLKGDRFMLCSDGIHGTMPEKDLIAKVTQRDNVGYIVDKLVHEVDEKGIADGGLHDNLTLVLMEMKTRSKLKEKMKNKTTLVLGIIAAILAIIALVLNSCKNKEIDVEPFQIATEQVYPGIDTVGIIGAYDFSMDVESMKIVIGCDSTLIDANSHIVTLTGKDYAVTVKNLKPNTTYYYTYSVSLGLVKDLTIPNKRFTTLKDGYNIVVASSPSQGTVTGGGRYTYGQNCTVRATANEGFNFINWTENGMVVSFDSEYSFSVSRDRFLDANFSPTQGFIITTISNPGQGIVSGGGIYYEGQTCTLRAIANEGYTFLNWTENDNIVSTNSIYTFFVNDNRVLSANFIYNDGGDDFPPGIIEGKFSVCATQKVYFSQGNLQYQPSTNTWRFAENQYDYIGNANSNISQSYNGWIDLFGWGTSGFPHGATCYQPYSRSLRYNDYYAYGSTTSHLYEQTGQADWGYNAISNGGNQTCVWRTLTKDEWVYLINNRNTSSGIRFVKAEVSGNNGIILLPDDWNSTIFTLYNFNNSNASFVDNIISTSEWSILQSSGAVFLPTAGCRTNNSVSAMGASGYYWSSSCYDDYYACMLSFSNTSLTPYQNDYRYYGQSVRVVYEIKE